MASPGQFSATAARVLRSPSTWLRVVVASVGLALLLAVISAVALGKGFSESLFSGWFVWGLIAVVAVLLPLDAVIDAEQAEGRQPEPRQLGRLAAGLGAVAATLYVGFGVSGAFDPEVDVGEVDARAAKVSRARRARCSEAGEDPVGDTIYHCEVTLRGTRANPALEGERLVRCFTLSGKDPIRLSEISCSTGYSGSLVLLRPGRGSRPAPSPHAVWSVGDLGVPPGAEPVLLRYGTFRRLRPPSHRVALKGFVTLAPAQFMWKTPP